MPPVLQIGRNVLLCGGEPGEKYASLAVRRSFDLMVEGVILQARVYAQPIEEDLAHAVSAESLARFRAETGLSASAWPLLVYRLFKIVIPNAGLVRDDLFARFFACLHASATSSISMTGFRVGAASQQAVILGRRSRPTDDAILVSSSGKGLDLLPLGKLQDFVIGPRNSVLASFTSAAALSDSPLLLTPTALIRVDLNRIDYADQNDLLKQELMVRPELCCALLSKAAFAQGLGDIRLPSRLDDHETGLVFTISATIAVDNGLFVSGWMLDCDQVLKRARIVSLDLAETDLTAVWSKFGAKTKLNGKTVAIERFVAFCPAKPERALVGGGFLCHIELRDGRCLAVGAVDSRGTLRDRRSAILDQIADYALTQQQFATVYRPAVDGLQAKIASQATVSEVLAFGSESEKAVSLVIPLYRDLSFIRSQIAAFHSDPFIRTKAEIVYVLDDPLIRRKAFLMLRGLADLFDIDIQLVVMAQNAGFAAASNMGAGQAQGEYLVLMNSDVIPRHAGWLQPLIERVEQLPAYSVVGPKLLYADGNIQHAGMFFARILNRSWQNFHFYKGYGADFIEATMARAVPAITGACMVIRRRDFLDVNGFSTCYVIGDYEDSDLCLKLRLRGGVSYYQPEAELFHFERQSMPEDGEKELGSTAYNRALHTYLWNNEIVSMTNEASD